MKKKDISAYLFLLPSLLGLVAFFYAPFLWSARFVLLDNRGAWQGLVGFADVLRNEMFQTGLKNTLLLCVLGVPLLLVLAALLAIVLFYHPRVQRQISGIVFLPYVLPLSAVLAYFAWAFDPRGPINALRDLLGLNSVLFLQSGALLFVVLILYLWRGTGFALVFLTARLSQMPREVLEAARLDGAGPVRIAWHLLLPLLRPVLVFAGILAFAQAQDLFREIYLLAGSYPPAEVYTVQHFIFNSFHSGDFGAAVGAAYLVTPLAFACYALLVLGVRHE